MENTLSTKYVSLHLRANGYDIATFAEPGQSIANIALGVDRSQNAETALTLGFSLNAEPDQLLLHFLKLFSASRTGNRLHSSQVQQPSDTD